MKASQFIAYLLASQAISAASLPEFNNALNILEDRRVVPASEVVSPDHTLERRKGGGGRGGGSSGGSSSASPTSNTGGSTSTGSGPSRSFGGGRYYGGGAAVPYSAGKKTPKGLSPGLLLAPAAILLIMPGLWLYSVYPYHYSNPYRFYNQSATDDDDNDRKRSLWTRQTQGRNETLPVMCLCQEFSVCGCDENDDQQYLDDLVGNGSYAALNKSLITVSDVNGTKTLVLNGTLPNGTTAPGGEGAAASLTVGNLAGYYAVALLVIAGVML
ncbi:hypothetical protein COCVIDRAFT_102286 [Bipolaris victoriae FI3]|uniref:DUF7732 domain-containing protein n=1 Tax=Bipolaris victoriae (strain FI3) TaxID=930091 RepID=W7E5Z3_BIPV3|nr:hypothetical protein COCVIDRAFT_102286 [Bipolaris victoriae FI3]